MGVNMELESKTRNIIENECEDYYLGIGDLSLANNPVVLQYKKLLVEYPRAISIGITLPYYKNKSTEEYFYKQSDLQLNTITTQICNFLEGNGYNALSIPKSNVNETDTFLSLHVIAANHSNMGRIKGNNLVMPHEMDLEVNWGTVLTDAPIKNL